MARTDPSEAVKTTVFEAEDPAFDATDADIWIDDHFTNEYGTERVALKGDTYPVKDQITADWHTTHHEPGEDDAGNFVWIVDADSLSALRPSLEGEGMTVDFGYGDNDTGLDNDALMGVFDHVHDGDRVTVQYNKKTGTGKSSKSGQVIFASDPDHVSEHEINPSNDRWDHAPILSFKRDDGQTMNVRFDRNHDVALFTLGSHAPFVGPVVSIEVHKELAATRHGERL